MASAYSSSVKKVLGLRLNGRRSSDILCTKTHPELHIQSLNGSFNRQIDPSKNMQLKETKTQKRLHTNGVSFAGERKS